MFKFMEPVMTPRGEGFFIAYLSGSNNDCQVAIREDGVQRNPIFRASGITPIDYAKSTKSTTSTTTSRMGVTLRDTLQDESEVPPCSFLQPASESSHDA